MIQNLLSFQISETSGATGVSHSQWRDCFKNIFCVSSCCKKWQGIQDTSAGGTEDMVVEITVNQEEDPSEDRCGLLMGKETLRL